MRVLKPSETYIVPEEIKRAHSFALERHSGQYRKFTNEPYIRHPEQVVCILAMYLGDVDLLTAAMLHDVVEDTHTTIQEVYSVFGDRVGNLVEELTTDSRQKRLLGKKIYMVNHINSLSEDAFTIKIADRLHNVMGLLHPKMSSDFIKWYMTETKYILDNLDRDDYSLIQNKLLDILEFMVEYIDIAK